MSTARKWQEVADISKPCADISTTCSSDGDSRLVLRMHFARVVDGIAQDLLLSFETPLTLRWEEESIGLLETPAELPRLDRGKHGAYAFPVLRVERSALAAKYAARQFAADDPNAERVVHFLLLSLNDTVEVVSLGEPMVKWVACED